MRFLGWFPEPAVLSRTTGNGNTVPHAGFPVDHTSPSPDLNAVQASTPSLPLPVWLLVCLLLLEMEELDQFSRLACVWRAERGIKAPRAGAIWPQTAAIGTLDWICSVKDEFTAMAV